MDQLEISVWFFGGLAAGLAWLWLFVWGVVSPSMKRLEKRVEALEEKDND